MPMERTEAIARLREHEAELKRLGVLHLYLFGSTARDDAREDSDVDLFFDYEQGKLGLFELMDVKDAAARILGRKTDIMTRDSIHRVLRERIEATAVPVF
jgi:predicted nucleotidyltransferase